MLRISAFSPPPPFSFLLIVSKNLLYVMRRAQHWIKDMKYSTRVKDEEGYPAIALVNKATGEALKHSLGQSHPVSSLSSSIPSFNALPHVTSSFVLLLSSRCITNATGIVQVWNMDGSYITFTT